MRRSKGFEQPTERKRRSGKAADEIANTNIWHFHTRKHEGTSIDKISNAPRVSSVFHDVKTSTAEMQRNHAKKEEKLGKAAL